MKELVAEDLSLFKKFKRCVDSRSIEKLDTKLYRFFMYECTFIAHYDIHGFRHEYMDQSFLNWFQVFAEPSWMFYSRNGKHESLKKACVDYAQLHQKDVFVHFERIERNHKIQLFHALAKELDMKEPNITATAVIPLPIQEEENGQMALFA